jgi:hypothetical protein
VAAGGAGIGEVARESFAPAYALGVALAAALGLARVVADVEGVLAVIACGLAGAALYWIAFYGLVLRPDERRFVRSLTVSRGARTSEP